MARIACLLVPDLPVAAACRADPDLIGTPLVLTDDDGPHARVVAAAPSARSRGVRPGVHSVVQARAFVADLVVRVRNRPAERAAANALADVAASLASRVECTDDGTVYLDAEGAAHLVDSEAGLATALAARAARVGLEVRVGVGSGLGVARLAALHGDGVEVVPAGAELGFLAPLPVTLLAPPADVAATLARWGVQRLGDLARLPAAEVATRLGPTGVALLRTARGEDERPLAPTSREGAVEEGVGLDWALDDLEPLLFVLRGLVERAVARLGLDGIGCTRLGLTLDLDDRSRDVRTLALIAPTRDVRTMLGCLRVELEARPPRAAIRQVLVRAEPEAIRPMQLGLFAPPGPAPERLATTLARLGVLCGPERVGAPVVVDTHRPGAAAIAPFAPPAPATSPPTPPAEVTCRLVVRALRPPRRLDVFTERERPTFVRGPGLGGRVVGVAGPWRVQSGWWTDAPCARDYFDLELSDGGLYRCYRELGPGDWWVDGVYD
jgi:protein ImuB